MPSFKTAFGSYLKTEDLQGRPARVVIETVQIEEVKSDDGIEKKLIAHFMGKDKSLILNRTNCELLEGIIGTDDYEAWAGQSVVLYPTTTKFGAKTVPCLRIRAVQVAPKPAPPPLVVVAPPVPEYDDGPLTVDDIPF